MKLIIISLQEGENPKDVVNELATFGYHFQKDFVAANISAKHFYLREYPITGSKTIYYSNTVNWNENNDYGDVTPISMEMLRDTIKEQSLESFKQITL